MSRAFDAMALEVAETQTRLRQDIAERKRADEALRVSEESYRAIFDAAEDAIFVHDVDGAIVDVNPKACATFGYSREEFRHIDIGDARLPASSRTRSNDAMDLIARAFAGEQLRIEWHGKSKDGTLRWHEVFMKRVVIGGNDRILALARDITGRKMAEAALRASEEQYHSMFNASIDGLALWNAAGEIVATNPALWRMYGYADGEFAALGGNAIGAVLSPGISARGRRRRIAALGGDGTAQGRLRTGARGARHPDAVPGPAARADHRARHHRQEALGGGARRGSANRCISARSSPRSARCWPASRTSSTIRFRSSWRARSCSRSKAIRRRRLRR